MTDADLDEMTANNPGRDGTTHWDTCAVGGGRGHEACTIRALVAEVRRLRAEVAEWTVAARKVFKWPPAAGTPDEYARRSEVVEKDGLNDLADLMLGNGWVHLESESALAQSRRELGDVVRHHDRLREALTWAVGFIRCNLPRAAAEYPDMRHAEQLVAGRDGLPTGEFQLAVGRAEVAEHERDRLRQLVRHCWVHSAYPDCGYAHMDTPTRQLYRSVIGLGEGVT